MRTFVRMDRVELEMEVDAGLSIAQLARRFGCSKGSVRYWLGKYGMRTRNPPKRMSSADAIAARNAGARSFIGSCPVHGEAELVRREDSFRCARCRADAVTARRRRVKEILVPEAGGACQICGYDRYPGALQFHHLGPAERSFSFGHRGLARTLDQSRAKARKCVLLCANCHAEVEGGVAQVSLH